MPRGTPTTRAALRTGPTRPVPPPAGTPRQAPPALTTRARTNRPTPSAPPAERTDQRYRRAYQPRSRTSIMSGVRSTTSITSDVHKPQLPHLEHPLHEVHRPPDNYPMPEAPQPPPHVAHQSTSATSQQPQHPNHRRKPNHVPRGRQHTTGPAERITTNTPSFPATSTRSFISVHSTGSSRSPTSPNIFRPTPHKSDRDHHDHRGAPTCATRSVAPAQGRGIHRVPTAAVSPETGSPGVSSAPGAGGPPDSAGTPV